MTSVFLFLRAFEEHVVSVVWLKFSAPEFYISGFSDVPVEGELFSGYKYLYKPNLPSYLRDV